MEEVKTWHLHLHSEAYTARSEISAPPRWDPWWRHKHLHGFASRLASEHGGVAAWETSPSKFSFPYVPKPFTASKARRRKLREGGISHLL